MSLLLRRGLLGEGFDPWSARFPTPVFGAWASDRLWTPPADGGAVSSWRCEGKNPFANGSGATQPVYDESDPDYGDRPVVVFSNDFLDSSNAAIAQPFVLVLVGNTAGANGQNERLIHSTASTTTNGFGDGSAGVSNAWNLNYGTGLNRGTSDSDPHIFTVIADGASSAIYLDGTIVGSAGNAGTGGHASGTRLGRAGDGTNGVNGRIGFAAGYSKSSRDAEILKLETALADFYGL